MTYERDPAFLQGLVRELCRLPTETSWVEFKVNNSSPDEIGEYISALSNAAALDGKDSAYLIWGVEDGTHDIVGTTFDPDAARKGAEPLENWLVRLLFPRLHFRFSKVDVDGMPVVILEIPRAAISPTRFSGAEYIRIGSAKQALKDYPERERSLWRVFDKTPFEYLTAAENLHGPDALALLDVSSCFDLLNVPMPSDQAGMLARLADDRMLVRTDAGLWSITNLGAILFARDIRHFPGLARKAVRVVLYDGKGRIKAVREQDGIKGYAAGFSGLVDYVNGRLPKNEVVGRALRKDVPMYPELAVRELIANALIHQDFSVTGAGPMVEIFSDRMEVTNPGVPLVDVARLLDSPPRSRNEALASFMRRIGVCEERGSGVDKVVFEAEFFQLPAPSFETLEGATRATLFAHREYKDMDKADRIRACYLHACLRYVQREPMTNASLRERFGIEDKNSAMVSRLIKEATEAGVIKPYDPDQKTRKYLPFWA